MCGEKKCVDSSSSSHIIALTLSERLREGKSLCHRNQLIVTNAQWMWYTLIALRSDDNRWNPWNSSCNMWDIFKSCAICHHQTANQSFVLFVMLYKMITAFDSKNLVGLRERRCFYGHRAQQHNHNGRTFIKNRSKIVGDKSWRLSLPPKSLSMYTEKWMMMSIQNSWQTSRSLLLCCHIVYRQINYQFVVYLLSYNLERLLLIKYSVLHWIYILCVLPMRMMEAHGAQQSHKDVVALD